MFPRANYLFLPIAVLAVAGASSNAASLTDILVEIDGKTFTAADVQRAKGGSTFQARNALYEAERKALDEFVDEQLLAREAQKQKLTVEQLLDRHAYASLPADPSEEALRVYYDGLDTAEPFDAIRGKISDLIRQRRMAKAKAAYLSTLRSRAAVSVRLQAPRTSVQPGDAPVRGARNGAVTIIEFADYECPYCQQIQPAIHKLLTDYKDKVAFAFKDVPLPMHANAQKAAEAAHCAGAQDKYWEYHDRLFATKQYSVADLKEHARVLGMDRAVFDLCLDSGAQADRVKGYLAEAQSLGLPGTPGFFVNGRFLSGVVDYDVLRRAIEEELKAGTSSERKTAQAR